MYLVDTNLVSEITRPVPDAGVVDWLKATDPTKIFLSAIVITELQLGLELLPEGRRRDQLTATVDGFVTQVAAARIVAFGEVDARQFARIVARRQHAGRPIKELDAQIAASAATRGFAVVTRNVADFEHCGIDVINPWKDQA